MTRRQGSRNADYLETRLRLLQVLSRRLAEEDGTSASFRELAAFAGVSTTTLRHYFKDRKELFASVFAMARQLGAEHLLRVASEPLQEDVATSMRWVLQNIRFGLEIPQVRHAHTTALRVALESPDLGPAYLQEMLEPLLRAVEVRLERHQARGELTGRDVRIIALQLVSPMFLALLHQHALFGSKHRPLEIAALMDALIAPLEAPRTDPKGT
ncbi:TetR/AcrR family transcriptional regulator [Chondromyces apiculatus]|uniref:Transcriptional regulator, TetR family n=1 Tax=Chondromyces apiculatus DSM 436 TaxID=1192034 RepID=A0A017T8J9_9BACT|nr:TetR/AcrR family transcriptional regulator [Chondromyces apiculatus]EYF05135.1 transcriptional regulator, TetR family [Chondromyces apiculatus DSM 436]